MENSKLKAFIPLFILFGLMILSQKNLDFTKVYRFQNWLSKEGISFLKLPFIPPSREVLSSWNLKLKVFFRKTFNKISFDVSVLLSENDKNINNLKINF
jgi:hypothetical protein